MITFTQIDPKTIHVLLDGKRVGEIRSVEGGFQYFPKGQKKGGEVFQTLIDCKKSLSDEEA